MTIENFGGEKEATKEREDNKEKEIQESTNKDLSDLKLSILTTMTNKEIGANTYEVKLSNPIIIDNEKVQTVWIKYSPRGDARVYRPNKLDEAYRLIPKNEKMMSIDGNTVGVLYGKDQKIIGLLATGKKATTIAEQENISQQIETQRETTMATIQEVEGAKTNNQKTAEKVAKVAETNNENKETQINNLEQKINSRNINGFYKSQLLNIITKTQKAGLDEFFNIINNANNIKELQRKLETKDDGVIGPITMNLLIKKLQQNLKDKGFNPGPIDGIAGNKTFAAIEEARKKTNS